MYNIKPQGVKKLQMFEELAKVFLRPGEFRIVDPQEPEKEAGLVAEASPKDPCPESQELAQEPVKEIVLPYEEDPFAMLRQLFWILHEETGYRPSWGIMTGVRPVKKTGEYVRQYGREQAKQQLMEYFLLEEEKADLLLEIHDDQMAAFGLPDALLGGIQEATTGKKVEGAGVYVGIPFCPTRCLYCSFASNQVKGDEIAQYVPALLEEITDTVEIMKDRGYYAESVYIGGGTPTTLTAQQLTQLLAKIQEIPGVPGGTQQGKPFKELTLEAGRPDTLQEDKLLAAKAGGVTRISINPQTMKEETLQRIGRTHTVEDIKNAFALARKAGFTDINADLIAGLPGETPEDMENTLRELLTLEPESITVHTLAVKRASRLAETDKEYHYKSGDITQKMLEVAEKLLREAGYRPYYLYRQKHMSGGGENIGWCKPGAQGLYNVRIMDEHQSIFACGAGAISKVYFPAEDRLERAPDLTNYELYIQRLKEMSQRKRTLFAQAGPRAAEQQR